MMKRSTSTSVSVGVVMLSIPVASYLSDGSTTSRIEAAKILCLGAVLILVLYAVFQIKFRIITAILCFSLAPILAQNIRAQYTKNALLEVHEILVTNGPPFPTVEKIRPQLSSLLLWKWGYWCSDDRGSFEIYYHSSSDSFCLSSIGQQWERRSAFYTGPSSKSDISD